MKNRFGNLPAESHVNRGMVKIIQQDLNNVKINFREIPQISYYRHIFSVFYTNFAGIVG